MNSAILNLGALAVIFTSSLFTSKLNIEDKNYSNPVEQSAMIPTAEKANNNILVSAQYVNGELIPVVNLPEFTVESDYNHDTFVHATISNGEVIPSVTLPTLNIVADI